jgi:hypothetical protein
MNHREQLGFYSACRLVLAYCPDAYAKSYAQAGLQMLEEDEIRTQSLYILNNISRWRGEEAKRVRGVLKQLGRGR